jgi:Phage integrase family
MYLPSTSFIASRTATASSAQLSTGFSLEKSWVVATSTPPGRDNDPDRLPARAAAAELVDLRWNQIDFGRNAALHVRRAKSGTPSTHPIQGDELRALRQLQREQDPPSAFVFVTERGAPFTTAGFARMIERVGAAADSGLKVHPHMLRHACGYALANAGHDTRALQAYLGHKNIQHTVRYTELAPTRFKDFWRYSRNGAGFFHRFNPRLLRRFRESVCAENLRSHHSRALWPFAYSAQEFF